MPFFVRLIHLPLLKTFQRLPLNSDSDVHEPLDNNFYVIYYKHMLIIIRVNCPALANISKSAKKIADTRVRGKASKIKGGIFIMIEKSFQCVDCLHEWSVPYETGRPNSCPQCSSSNLHRSEKDSGPARRGGSGQGRRKGRCGRQMS